MVTGYAGASRTGDHDLDPSVGGLATPAWESVGAPHARRLAEVPDRQPTWAQLGKVSCSASGLPPQELLGGRNPVGAEVQIGQTTFTVIGVLAESGATSSTTTSNDDMVIMPWTTAATTVGTSATTVSTIYLEARDGDSLSAAYQQAHSALLTLHKITTGPTPTSRSPARSPSWRPRPPPIAP